MYFGLPNRVGRQCISRAVKLADGREELLVHAPTEPKDEEGCWDAEWMLQPLILPQEPCCWVAASGLSHEHGRHQPRYCGPLIGPLTNINNPGRTRSQGLGVPPNTSNFGSPPLID